VLLCRYLMHQDPKDVPTMKTAADRILKLKPAWNKDDGSIDMYYWYYGSFAMYQVGGSAWDQWAQAMTPAVVKSQHKKGEGNLTGSWDPIDPWGSDGGRVYSTAILVLCLEAYYRYSRVLGGR